MVVVLGIDPDSKGSVALLDCIQWTLDVYPVPNLHKILSSGKKRLQVDFPVLVAIMNDLILSVPVATVLSCFIEDQWSRPMQDIAATFTAGQNFGDIRTALASGLLARVHGNTLLVRDQIRFVSGADWKGAMGLSSDKAATRAIADQVFPACKHAWKLISKHTSAAEASLLAVYGASVLGIKIPRGTIIMPYLQIERTAHVRSLTRS